jgi:hypothetical protein
MGDAARNILPPEARIEGQGVVEALNQRVGLALKATTPEFSHDNRSFRWNHRDTETRRIHGEKQKDNWTKLTELTKLGQRQALSAVGFHFVNFVNSV